MKYLRSASLRARLVATTAGLVLAGLAGLTVVNAIGARQLQQLGSQTTALARAHAADIGGWVGQHQQVVHSMAAGAAAADPLPALRQAEAAGGFDTTYVGHADRRIEFSKPQDLPPGYDPTARPWYQQAAAASGQPVLTAPYLDAATKKLVVTFAQAVDGGQAVVAGDVFMDGVVKVVGSIRPTPGTRAFLVSRAGQVVVHEDAARVLKPAAELSPGLAPEALAALGGREGLAELEIGGQPRLLRAEPIAGTDWLLVLALDRGEALAGVMAMVWQSVAASLVVTVVAVLLLAWTLGRQLRRLKALEHAMAEVASGDGDLGQRLPSEGGDELASIARHFNAFVAKIEQAVRQIREASDSVHVAAGEIAGGNADLSARTEQTAASLQRAASAMQQITGTGRESADSARIAHDLATSAAEVASRGGAVVQRVVATIAQRGGGSGACRRARPRLRRRGRRGARAGPALGSGGTRDQGPDRRLGRQGRERRRAGGRSRPHDGGTGRRRAASQRHDRRDHRRRGGAARGDRAGRRRGRGARPRDAAERGAGRAVGSRGAVAARAGRAPGRRRAGLSPRVISASGSWPGGSARSGS